MDFLQRLEQLMNIKGVSKAQMAAGSGIGKTTVYAWWDKGYEGITLPKLKKLCDYFGCTLDWLCCGDESEATGISLPTDDLQLIDAYHAADPAIQASVRKLLDIPAAKESGSAQSAM